MCFAQPPLTITASKSRVQGLTYDATSKQQTATWVFTATPPAGNPTINFWNWKIDGVAQPGTQGNVPFTLTVHGVGHHLVEVMANGSITYDGAITVAAIGGPLTVMAKVDASMPATFANDQDDPTKPAYAQYFNYSHASPPTSKNAQKTQDAMAMATSQLAGTTMAWSFGSFRCPELVANPTANLASITLQAESAGSATVSCHFTYTDPNDATLTGSADDDTAQTPNPSSPTAMMVNKVNAHEPASSAISSTVPLSASDVGVTVGTGQVFAGSKSSILVKDQLGSQMPGVWVQERFTSNPTGLSIEGNGDGAGWTTQMPPDKTPPDWAVFPSGVFTWDFFWVLVPTTFPGATAVHHYWAATLGVLSTEGGIDVGTYTITFSTTAAGQVKD